MVLLIGGQMRSGTTLLTNLCNTHPEIVITYEFNYFSILGESYTKHRRLLIDRLWRKTNRGIRLVIFLGNYYFVGRYLFEIRKHRKGLIDVAVIESALQKIFPEARIVGDKTPNYAFLLDKFAATSGLSCLITFRDCRDVTSSMLERVRTKWRKDRWMQQNYGTAEKIAKRWVRCIELMEHHKDKIHTIRYEDLVREPGPQLEALGKWLGVDPAGFTEKLIRKTNMSKYKTGLTDDELRTVMEIAGPTMTRLGYN